MMFDTVNPSSENSHPNRVESTSAAAATGRPRRAFLKSGIPNRVFFLPERATFPSGIMWMSIFGARAINCSENAVLKPNLRLPTALRPITILVTSDRRAYSAIWNAISSPYTVVTVAPDDSARRILFCSRSLSSCGRLSAPGFLT